MAQPGPGAAHLARDRNGNGVVDSGAERSGPSRGPGFGELAALDGDRSGWVDEGTRPSRGCGAGAPPAARWTRMASVALGRGGGSVAWVFLVIAVVGALGIKVAASVKVGRARGASALK